jgi:hypothetical protein
MQPFRVKKSMKLRVGAVEKKHECLRVDTQLKLSTLRDLLGRLAGVDI